MGPWEVCMPLRPPRYVLLRGARALRGSIALQARSTSAWSRASTLVTLLPALRAEEQVIAWPADVPRRRMRRSPCRRPRQRASSTLGWTHPPQLEQARGGGGGLAAAGLDCASCRKSPGGWSDLRAHQAIAGRCCRCLCTESTLTESVFSQTHSIPTGPSPKRFWPRSRQCSNNAFRGV